MRLQRLQVNRFGCLNDFAAEFQPGLNIIRGPNESGKSTLHQALLMALMALPNQNQTTGLWRAWGSEQWYRLQLSFTDDQGRQFRLTKDFEDGFQELQLPGGETTRSRDAINDALQAVLGTHSLLMLRSTLCVEQDALAEIANGRTEISQSLEAIVTGGEDDVYTERALKQLDNTMREFRVGMVRVAARPGPLASARDEQAQRSTRVANYRTQVQAYEHDELSLQEAEARLAKIEEELGPLRTTKQQVQQVQKYRAELDQWEQREQALETKLEQIRKAQDEINETKGALAVLGAVALTTEQDVRAANVLSSRIHTLLEERETHLQAMVKYERDLAEHREQQATYEAALGEYRAAKAAFEQAQEAYQAEMAAYEGAVRQYDSDLAAFQEAWRPYEEALAAQEKEAEEYERRRAAYEARYTAYEAELAQYDAAKSEQEQLLVAHEQAYELYERELAAYEQQRETYERQRELYDQAQADYQQALEKYETDSAATRREEPLPAAGKVGKSRSKLLLPALGALVALLGIALLLIANNVLAGVLAIAVGLVIALAGLLRKTNSDGGQVAPAAPEQGPPALPRPEPPTAERPEPFTLQRPQPPQRPKLPSPAQPQPPALPKPIAPAGEPATKPAIERPQQPAVQKPMPPAWNQPQPPAQPRPAPIKPAFDESRLHAAQAQLEQKLAAANCASVDDLNRQFAAATELRSRQDAARSRLQGLLGSSTVETLAEQRRVASRRRRDAEEALSEPGLQLAAGMTPVEVNKLQAGIERLETEQAELGVTRQRLQLKLEDQPGLAEDLLRAEEQLVTAKTAYQRAQERNEVYQLTYDLLAEARAGTLKRAQEQLGPRTAAYLERLTHGRYRQAWIDPELQIELADPAQPDRRISPRRLSRGAQDQLYMATRLALVDLLFPAANPPILLDDPFVHFDPQRLAAAIDICCELAGERQLLLFTCSDRYNHVGHHIHMPGIEPQEQQASYGEA